MRQGAHNGVLLSEYICKLISRAYHKKKSLIKNLYLMTPTLNLSMLHDTL